MQHIKTPIIPSDQTFVKLKDQPHELDFKAICIFTALGFFLDTDTYWKDEKVLAPASIHTIDDEGFLISSKPWFEWYYKPKNINLEEATDQFEKLFENIVDKQSKNKRNIVPLSGGLDSRTQAVALYKLNAKVSCYSYSFDRGYRESSISKKLAKVADFPFYEFTIPSGYLWKNIEALAEINQCYSEFTHPRQMAIIDKVADLGDCFSLGHWGDVLFDSEDYTENLTDRELLAPLKKKLLKKGGLELPIHYGKTGT